MKSKTTTMLTDARRLRKGLALALLAIATMAYAQAPADTVRQKVTLQTSLGDIVIELYNETPLHRDNFLRHVKNGDYDDITFHRVVKKFMIQTGDPFTKPAEKRKPGYGQMARKTIPAEIRFPQFFHKKGAVAAARESDDVNPNRESSGTQFYIVVGNRRTDWEMDHIQKTIDEATQSQVTLNEEVREVYRKIGGTPHLDGQYTVFGEVVSGLDIVDAIQNVDTDDMAKPIEEIRIIKARVMK